MPLERPLVVLFDVDGTLVRTEGKSRHSRAFLAAFRQVHGIECRFEKEMHGMTDRQIFLRVGPSGLGWGMADWLN